MLRIVPGIYKVLCKDLLLLLLLLYFDDDDDDDVCVLCERSPL